ncbi:MAG: hypothetical protein V1911_03825, partial [Candidatus Micrarchaeota archaeon]
GSVNVALASLIDSTEANRTQIIDATRRLNITWYSQANWGGWGTYTLSDISIDGVGYDSTNPKLLASFSGAEQYAPNISLSYQKYSKDGKHRIEITNNENEEMHVEVSSPSQDISFETSAADLPALSSSAVKALASSEKGEIRSQLGIRAYSYTSSLDFVFIPYSENSRNSTTTNVYENSTHIIKQTTVLFFTDYLLHAPYQDVQDFETNSSNCTTSVQENETDITCFTGLQFSEQAIEKQIIVQQNITTYVTINVTDETELGEQNESEAENQTGEPNVTVNVTVSNATVTVSADEDTCYVSADSLEFDKMISLGNASVYTYLNVKKGNHSLNLSCYDNESDSFFSNRVNFSVSAEKNDSEQNASAKDSFELPIAESSLTGDSILYLSIPAAMACIAAVAALLTVKKIKARKRVQEQ